MHGCVGRRQLDGAVVALVSIAALLTIYNTYITRTPRVGKYADASATPLARLEVMRSARRSSRGASTTCEMLAGPRIRRACVLRSAYRAPA